MSAPAGPDGPWIFRTYAGFATPAATNARFKANLAGGQTGLSVAFDLPTQTGYDSDDELAAGEVGRVGVPIGHVGDMRTLLAGIPLGRMNTSMTINATAVWLLALYATVAGEQGAAARDLAGTTQNDILKEFLARGAHAFPPGPSMRLTTDLIAWTHREMPRWNPINVCSYHLQEAGADPVLEAAYTMANAAAVLDATRASGGVPEDELPVVVGRISFFCNAGIRFVEETAKVRAMARMWDRLARERYAVEDPTLRRFRYGVQVNSLGLTAQQPENNVYRILLEMLAVTLSKDARARAIQLPAWNEALGLPRAWDQQWSLRAQQILALETDLLEHEDLFAGSRVMRDLTERIEAEAWDELQVVLDMGGSTESLAYMKGRLVAKLSERLAAIESGERIVVGLNRYPEGVPSPLVEGVGDGVGSIERIELESEVEQVERLEEWRRARDAAAASRAVGELRRVAADERVNLVAASLAAAQAGVTTGEWAGALREVYGDYRPPTGLSGSPPAPRAEGAPSADTAREAVRAAERRVGVARLRMLVGKPGLDGHSNAAEQVALRARDAGFEVIYQGIRLTPSQIARAAADEDVHVIGLSVLSGAHNRMVADVLDRLRDEGVDRARVPVVVGGVIPNQDAAALRALGVARVFTPLDGDIGSMIAEMANLLGGSDPADASARSA